MQNTRSRAQYPSPQRRGLSLIHEGDTVRFQVADIVLPTAEDLPVPFASAGELEGIVLNFSDSGLRPHVFAVVDVTARRSCVVPVEKLHKLNAR